MLGATAGCGTPASLGESITHLRREKPQMFGYLVGIAEQYRITPLVFLAMVREASAFNVTAISAAGSHGLCQLLPSTAADLGVEPSQLLDGPTNCDAGATLLRRHLDQFGNFALALAAYQAGAERVRRFRDLGSDLPKETRCYVARILQSVVKELDDPDGASSL